ncbi:MAG: hypothetical protein AAGL69_01030 [Pseudomonadota bacterium]
MRFKDYLLAGLAALSLAASSISSATTIEKEEFKDLVQNAHACVVARTVSIEHAMENGSPVTKTTFAVTETAFGTTPETITVTTPGGRLSNATVPMGEVNAGIPRFLNGTSAVLLLQERTAGEYSVSGVNQGVFDMRPSAFGAVVQMPTSQGGIMSLEQALSVINEAREADANQIAE